MRVVCDTNVLVSGILFQGPPRLIVGLASRGRIANFTSPALLREAEDVLLRPKFRLTPDQVAEWRACSSEVLDNYMRGGGELVRQVLAAYGKLRTHPCCNAGPVGTFNRR